MTGTGTSEARKSEGPDRFHGSIKCRQFHDRQDLDLGGDSRCCCCNPCNTIKQSARGNDQLITPEWNYCCNCVPRVINLRFIPDTPGTTGTGSGDCCPFLGVTVPMVHNRSGGTGPIADDDPVWSVYSGSVFDIDVGIKVGRVGKILSSINGQTFDYEGAEQFRSCGWDITVKKADVEIAHILYTMWDNETGTGWEEITGTDIGGWTEVRYDPDVTCIEVPQVTLVEGVEGPDGCIGSVVLGKFTRTRLPFIENSETKEFTDNQGEKYGYLCGECEESLDDISCLLVDGDTYTLSGEENGKPYFTSDSYKLYWDGNQWLLAETPLTGTSEDITLATGGTDPDCPIGLFTWEPSGTGTGSEPECFCVTGCGIGQEYIQPCGCCGYVCTKVCLYGERHSTSETEPTEYATFTWFENREETGELISRGWSYANPVTENTEYLYLDDITALAIEVDGDRWEREYQYVSYGSDDDPHWIGYLSGNLCSIFWDTTNWRIRQGSSNIATGPSDPDSPAGTYTLDAPPGTTYTVTLADDYDHHECWLRPRLETTIGTELYLRQKIDGDTLCGCSIYALFEGGSIDDPRYLRVRCGFCTCWDFYCGKCRCVPSELCVYYYDGTSIDSVVLGWDAHNYRWGDDDSPLQLLFQKNETTGDCEITPMVPGYNTGTGTLATAEPVAHDCKIESITRHYDWESDFLEFSYSDFMGETIQVWILAVSNRPECGMSGSCPSATPCAMECGSHPPKIYATITQHILDAMGGDHGDVVYEVELIYLESSYLFRSGLNCGYVGFIPKKGSCCAIIIEVSGGTICFFNYESDSCLYPWPSVDVPAPDQYFHALTESCNPYYGYTATFQKEMFQRECWDGGNPTGLNWYQDTEIILTE